MTKEDMVTKRIYYFAKKARQYSDLQRSYPQRHKRLMQYKAAMQRQIERG